MSTNKSRVNPLNGVLIAALTFAGGITATMYEDRQVLEKRVEKIEELANLETERRHKAELLILQLENELNQSFQVIDVIQAYIDALPFPAWIKRKLDNGQFQMVIINRAYAIAFDVTKEQYEGRLDSEIWPIELAEQYRLFDEEVYASRKVTCNNETVIRNKERVLALVCKIPIKMNGKDYGVGGLIIEKGED